MCYHPWELTGKWGRDGNPIWGPPHSSSLTLSYENKTNGKWKAASLAEYPCGFCKFIASAIASPNDAAASVPTPLGPSVPDQGPSPAASIGAVVPDYTSVSLQSSGPRVPDPGSPAPAAASA